MTEVVDPDVLKRVLARIDVPEREVLLSSMAPVEENAFLARDPFDPSYEYDPNAGYLGASNVARMVGNIPSSLGRLAEGVVRTPELAMRGIAGSGEEVQRRFMGGPDTENSQVFRAMSDVPGAMAEEWSSPGKKIVEDPIGSLLDLSVVGGVLSRLAGATRAGGLALETSRGLSPIGRAKEIVGAAGNVLRKSGEQLASFPTGFEPNAFEFVYRGGRQSAQTANATRGILREATAAPNLAQQVTEAGQRVVSKWEQQYIAGMKKLRLKQGQALELQRFKKQMFDWLADPENGLNVKLIPKNGQLHLSFSNSKVGRGTEQAAIRELVADITKWQDNSIAGMDRLKQRISTHMRGGGGSDLYKQHERVVTAMYDNLRAELGKKVEGYDETVYYWERARDFDKRLGQMLKTDSENPETIINRLIPILREPANYDVRRAFISQLEELSGSSLKSQIAALELSQIAPKGLIGRSAAMGLLAMGGAKEGKFLYFLPLVSPRVGGELFLAMGVGKRYADEFAEYLSKVHQFVPPGGLSEAISIGAFIDKYMAPPPDPMAGVRLPGLAPSSGMPQPQQ